MKEIGSCQEIRNNVDKAFDWKGISKKDHEILRQVRTLSDRLPLYLQQDTFQDMEDMYDLFEDQYLH